MKHKKTLRETYAENAKAESMWGAAFGKPVREDLPALKEKQVRVKAADDSQLEASVLRDVADMLEKHPKIVFAVRQNAGMSYNEGGAPVYFYRWARSKVKMRIADFWGMLNDGRMFAIECKRRSWTAPSGEREAEQQAFLMTVRYNGGVSGFATSMEQAREIIETKQENDK